jgi:heme-degrading monooxygenase HmoA
MNELQRFPGFHLAQVNIARMRAPLESPLMSGFAARIKEINELADGSPGFVWRSGVATDESYLRPYEDDTILFNLSLWESVEHLHDYVYRSAHRELWQNREQWFHHSDEATLALWWVGAGHLPSVQEAKERLEHLRVHGETPFAFSFRKVFAPESHATPDAT